MNVPFTKKMLIDWAGGQVVRDAQSLIDKGAVLNASFDPPRITGSVLWNNRELKTALTLLGDGTVQNHCPCYTNRERGLICPHAIAVAATLVERSTDPRREAKASAEMRRARRLASVGEDAYITRVSPDTPGAMPATVRLTLKSGWESLCASDRIPLCCDLLYQDERVPIGEADTELPLTFQKRDESLLYVLEDICEGPVTSTFEVNRTDFINILRLRTGTSLYRSDSDPLQVNATPLASILKIDMDPDDGRLVLLVHTELPFSTDADDALYVVSGSSGWIFEGEAFWPLEHVLPTPYQSLYTGTVAVARENVIRFFRHDVPLLGKTLPVATDLTEDLFDIVPAEPSFHLAIRGSPASLAATLTAEYGDVELVASKPDRRSDFAIPDTDDLMRYYTRNTAAETSALGVVSQAGFRGETGDSLEPIVGKREVLNFLGSQMPALRRRGWHITLDGRVAPYLDSMDFVTPVVNVTPGDVHGWFDVGFQYDGSGEPRLDPGLIQTAIRKGESFIEQDGRVSLLDSGAITAMQSVFEDCMSSDGDRPGHFRLSSVYAGFVKASLDALDGIDVEDTPDWRRAAETHNRTMKVERVALPKDLERTLRPYQRDGVNWLRFLERNGFCGLLADEMGLGKTLQALAWLQLQRCSENVCDAPALVVCPTSLVDNWAEEVQRFVPELRVLRLVGADRTGRFSELPGADLAITSYALLRRDIDRLVQTRFSAVILDEAQHIKNRSTQNARSAKQLDAAHRLVLTGTPVENSVADVWSIMDFLMPGYLGGYKAFRDRYELPIQRGADEAHDAQHRLRRKLHPFLLRRLKRDVAADLPPKIERVQGCDLTPDQKTVYVQLLSSARDRIHKLVKQRGFNRSRMEILTLLTRLRQTCCHLDLLKMANLKTDSPSGKLDVFLELLDEATDSGHRVLVFSQFVSMLKILREHLEQANTRYCYLDGSTQNRMAVVHEFNACRDIPVFLISLKAGGTGLNLTGADMVIHFDPWWNPAVENQATDRAYRIGQKRTVYSVKLITRGTVEEKVVAMQTRKKAIIDATVETDEGMMTKMTWDDIQELIEV